MLLHDRGHQNDFWNHLLHDTNRRPGLAVVRAIGEYDCSPAIHSLFPSWIPSRDGYGRMTDETVANPSGIFDRIR